MKQFMFATEFSEATGYPLKNIRKMAHNGILPHQKCGRKYLLHVPTVLEILKLKVVGEIITPETSAVIENQSSEIKVCQEKLYRQQERQKRNRKTKKLPMGWFESGLKDLVDNYHVPTEEGKELCQSTVQ